jgi:hypothetical protein
MGSWGGRRRRIAAGRTGRQRDRRRGTSRTRSLSLDRPKTGVDVPRRGMHEYDFGMTGYDNSPCNVGYATLHDHRELAREMEHVGAVRSWSPALVAHGDAERISALRASWPCVDMLGLRPALGRGFRREDDRREQWRVLLMSDGLWRRRFDGRPHATPPCRKDTKGPER